MHVCACTRPLARVPAHTHAQTNDTYCFSTAIMIRERASLLRYTYVSCLVHYCDYSSCSHYWCSPPRAYSKYRPKLDNEKKYPWNAGKLTPVLHAVAITIAQWRSHSGSTPPPPCITHLKVLNITCTTVLVFEIALDRWVYKHCVSSQIIRDSSVRHSLRCWFEMRVEE